MNGIVIHNERRFPASDEYHGAVIVTLVDVEEVMAGGGKRPGDCALMLAPDGGRYCRLRTGADGRAAGVGLEGWALTTQEDREILAAAVSDCMRPDSLLENLKLVLPSGGIADV